MHTDDLRLTGPSAIVDIAGDADLAHETQQLKVQVQPSLSSGVSAGAAALFLANPLVGAAVGAGTLLAQKIFNNPIEQLFSYEYTVTGGWDDPLVARVRRRVPRRRRRCRDADAWAADEASAMRVAAVQMTSGGDVGENLRQAEALGRCGGARRCRARAASGELRPDGPARARQARRAGSGRRWRPAGIPRADAAQRNRQFVIGGSVPIAKRRSRPRAAALLVYGPDGARVARYDKIHLFRFTQGDEDYDEARTIEAGSAPASFDAPCGRVGLSICYDLRFPELYRRLGDLSLIVVPAAFTAPTGEAHWEMLLRARAIENQCYVLASAQAGTASGRRRTWGHSMLIDPWGAIVAEQARGSGHRRRRRGSGAHRRRSQPPAGTSHRKLGSEKMGSEL